MKEIKEEEFKQLLHRPSSNGDGVHYIFHGTNDNKIMLDSMASHMPHPRHRIISVSNGMIIHG